jgi:hypothetical protein
MVGWKGPTTCCREPRSFDRLHLSPDDRSTSMVPDTVGRTYRLRLCSRLACPDGLLRKSIGNVMIFLTGRRFRPSVRGRS